MKALRWLIFTVVFLPVALILSTCAYTTINKAYWDGEVRELCEADAGITIYETVILTPEDVEKYGRYGSPMYVPLEDQRGASEYPYYYSSKDTLINDDNPRVRKRVSKIYRRKDGVIIAESVYFGRSGGEFPGLSGPGFGCKDLEGYISSMESLVFIIQGEKNDGP